MFFFFFYNPVRRLMFLFWVSTRSLVGDFLMLTHATTVSLDRSSPNMSKISLWFQVVTQSHVSWLAEGGVDMSQYMNSAAVLLARAMMVLS